MGPTTSDQKAEHIPEIDLRKVFKADRELLPAGSPIVEAEIFRGRANSADTEIKELRRQIERLEKKRESNRDKWHENLDGATDEMLQRKGANPVDGNGVLDYTINGTRVQIESINEDSIQFTMYSSDSPLEPDEVREVETLAETVERELSNERQKIEDRQSKTEAAEEYRSMVEEQINSKHASREVVRELHDSHITENLGHKDVEGEHVLGHIIKALSEVGLGYRMTDKIKDFHRDKDLEPEECAAIALDTLRNESEYSSDDVRRPKYSTGEDAKGVLEEINDQLDVSESDFQPYSPREIVNEVTRGCTEIAEALDEDWRGYDDHLERAEKFVNSVEQYLETIGYYRDTLEGIPYERAEEIADLT